MFVQIPDARKKARGALTHTGATHFPVQIYLVVFQVVIVKVSDELLFKQLNVCDVEFKGKGFSELIFNTCYFSA